MSNDVNWGKQAAPTVQSLENVKHAMEAFRYQSTFQVTIAVGFGFWDILEMFLFSYLVS